MFRDWSLLSPLCASSDCNSKQLNATQLAGSCCLMNDATWLNYNRVINYLLMAIASNESATIVRRRSFAIILSETPVRRDSPVTWLIGSTQRSTLPGCPRLRGPFVTKHSTGRKWVENI